MHIIMHPTSDAPAHLFDAWNRSVEIHYSRLLILNTQDGAEGAKA